MLGFVGAARPISIGDYDVLEEIGRGGMGVVYRARSRRDGGDYALKTIRDLAAGPLAALRAEVTALRLVDHPSIVRVFDDGLLETRPWYAMELVRGQSLAAYVRSMHAEDEQAAPVSAVTERVSELRETALSRPLPSVRRRVWSKDKLHDVLRAYRELTLVLAHLHRNGIVHRDVKPSNVFLGQDSSVKLLDFGLASRFDGPLKRSDLWRSEPARLAGTVPYLSPEAIQGHALDSRSDLYSLGCTLYESLVGTPPFSGRGKDVLNDHLHVSPIAPSQHVDGLPDELVSLVLGLLAKDRTDRIAYADDVAIRIDGLLGLRSPRGGPGSTGHLLKPPLVGRDTVLAELRRHAARVLAGTSEVLTLRGESGIGKSFLFTEFTLEALALGFAVIVGGAPAPAAPELDAEAQNAPLAGLRGVLEALADRCRARTVSTCGPLTHDDFLLLARYEPTLSLVPGFHALPTQGLPQDAFGDERVLEAVQRAVDFFIVEQPLLLLLDDLQWADQLTSRFVSALRTHVTKRRVFAICAERREPSSKAPAAVLAGPDVIELDRLTDDEVRALAAGMLGVSELPRDVADALIARSAGSPLFVAEHLRSAVAAGVLTRRDGKWEFSDRALLAYLDDLPLSAAVGDLFAGRISGLSQEAQDVLKLAAVIGRDVEPELIQQLAPAANVMGALVELRRHAVLDQRPGEPLRFLHDRLREKICEQLERSEAVSLHREVVRALELQTAWSERRAALLPRIANHWLAAAEPLLAARAFKDAGDYARTSGAHADAVQYFEAGIAALDRLKTAPQPAELQDWLGELEEAAGDLWLIQADAKRAEARFMSAEQRSGDAVTIARLRRKQAGTFTARQNPRRATELLEQAEALLERVDDRLLARVEWIDSRIERAWSLYWPGRATELAQLILETEHIVREHGTPTQRARLHHCAILSDLRTSRYRIDGAMLDKGNAAMAAADQDWNSMEALSMRFTLGFMLVLGGFGAEALPLLQQAVRGAEDLADRARLIRTKAYLSVAHRLNGDDEACRMTALATLEIEQTHSQPFIFYKGLALANLGWVLARVEELTNAEKHFAQALTLWLSPTPAYPFTGFAVWPQLLLAARRGDVGAARSAATVLLRPDQQHLAQGLQTALLAVARSADDSEPLTHLRELIELTDVPGARGLTI
jgi:tetratricopeptide (TPR) repeat protein